MTRKGQVETYYEDGQWKNKAQGNPRASSVHDSKASAVDAGMEMAKEREVEHVVRNMDGTIDARNDYAQPPTKRSGVVDVSSIRRSVGHAFDNLKGRWKASRH